MGVGGWVGVSFPGKKCYECVRFSVISITMGWVGFKCPGKKRYVALEWPLRGSSKGQFKSYVTQSMGCGGAAQISIMKRHGPTLLAVIALGCGCQLSRKKCYALCNTSSSSSSPG